MCNYLHDGNEKTKQYKNTAFSYNKQGVFVQKEKNYSQHPVKIVFNHSTPEFLQVKYQYNIKQTSDESKEKYYLGDCLFIQYQLLQTNIISIVWQRVRRITDKILRVKGLTRFLM